MTKYLGLLGKIKENEEFYMIATEPEYESNIYYPYDINRIWYLEFLKYTGSGIFHQPLKFKFERDTSSSKIIKISLNVFDKDSKKRAVSIDPQQETLYFKAESDHSDSTKETTSLTFKPYEEKRPLDALYTGMWYKLYPDGKDKEFRFGTRKYLGHPNDFMKLKFMFIPTTLSLSKNKNCVEINSKDSIDIIYRIISGTEYSPKLGSSENIMWSSLHPVTQRSSNCSKFISYQYGDECDGFTYNICETGTCGYKDSKSLKCIKATSLVRDSTKVEEENFFQKYKFWIIGVVLALVFIIVAIFFFIKKKR